MLFNTYAFSFVISSYTFQEHLLYDRDKIKLRKIQMLFETSIYFIQNVYNQK